MTDNIYITGFMGAGKSTVGRKLARLTRRRFVDMDEVLADKFGLPIPEVFRRLGEETFRRAETDLLTRLSRRRRLVAATGGGAPVSDENRRIMRASGRIVHLSVSLETCRRRLTTDEQDVRPLWRDETAVRKLYEQRQEAYADCDHRVKVDSLGPDETVGEILAGLYHFDSFTAVLGQASCPVVPTFQGPKVLAGLTQGRRTALVTDRNVARLHLDRYRRILEPDVEIILPAGERGKTLNNARRLYESFLEASLDRGDLLVALGGGMITDLGAFAAATYKRGMDFALVSTSLLGCVDAAVGGKAGVNLGPAKNVVGAFTLPNLVILDLLALGTLPPRQIAEGLIEAYKTGLVAGPDLAALVEDELGPLLSGDLPAMARAACLSAQTKAEVVAEDFRENGLRRILNLGHTYGHAIEGFYDYRVSHGQAVAAGMMAAVNISAARRLLSEDKAARINETIRAMVKRPVKLPPLDQAWEIMKNDKKNRGGKVLFVLLAGIGRPVCVEDVTPEELAKAAARLKGD